MSEDLAAQLENSARYSPFVWAVSRVVLPNRTGQWDFSERKWQINILEDTFPRICSEKSAQVGLTTIFICKALWFMDYRSVRVIWTLPRQDDVSEFVQTTFTPLMSKSPALIKHVGRGQGDPKSVRITKYRDSYIYFQESSVEPRMTPADLLAQDEIDRSNPDYLDSYVGRLEDSPYKVHYRFSTPTIPNFGIDAIFHNESDQRYWMVKCSHCNHFQNLKWDANLMMDADGQPYYGCEKCRGILSPDEIINGEYVAMSPEKTKDVHGYHVTGMMMPISKPPAYMFQRSQNMILKNFYNILLGETFEASSLRFDSGTILSNVFDPDEAPYDRQSSAKGATYMGVDQKGRGDLHVVIAQVTPNNATGKEVLRIIHAEEIGHRAGRDTWKRLHELMRLYNIRFCVHDATPNLHPAGAFRERHIGKVALKFDGPERSDLFSYDERTGKLLLSRTMNFDGLLDDVKNGLWRFWGVRQPLAPVLAEIVAHCGNNKRDEVERKKRDGSITTVGVWRRTGADDFAHAWAYCRAAFMVRPANRMQVTLIGEARRREQLEESVEYEESVVWPGLMVRVKKKKSGAKIA